MKNRIIAVIANYTMGTYIIVRNNGISHVYDRDQHLASRWVAFLCGYLGFESTHYDERCTYFMPTE